jgi:hypothetical protein
MTWFTGKPVTSTEEDLSGFSAVQMHEILHEAYATGMPLTFATPKTLLFGHSVWNLLENHTYYLYQYNPETRSVFLGNPWDASASNVPVESLTSMFDTMVVGPRLGVKERLDLKPELPDVMGDPRMREFRQAMMAVAGLDLRLTTAPVRGDPVGPERRAAAQAILAGLEVAIRTMNALLIAHEAGQHAAGDQSTEIAASMDHEIGVAVL